MQLLIMQFNMFLWNRMEERSCFMLHHCKSRIVAFFHDCNKAALQRNEGNKSHSIGANSGQQHIFSSLICGECASRVQK